MPGAKTRGGRGSRGGRGARGGRGSHGGRGSYGGRGSRGGSGGAARSLAETFQRLPDQEAGPSHMPDPEDAGPSWDSDPTLRENLAVARKRRAEYKKAIRNMDAEARRKLLQMKAKKERGVFLMPDSPRKKSRKLSPERGPCPLAEGTPAIPPAWEIGSSPESIQREVLSPTTGILVDAEICDLSPESSPVRPTSTLDPFLSAYPASPNIDEVDNLEIIAASSNIDEVDNLEIIAASPNIDEVDNLEIIAASPNIDEVDNLEIWMQRGEGSDLDDDDDDDRIPNRLNFGDIEEDLSVNDAVDDAELWRAAVRQQVVTDFNWTSDPSTFTGTKEPFVGPSGPTFPVDGETPLSIFQKFWDHELMSLLVRETNRYAHQLLAQKHTLKSRISKWVDVDVEEMWIYFAVLMLHGIFPLSVEKDYWLAKSQYMKFSFGQLMPFKRFLLLKRCLHFVDNTQIAATSQQDKRLAKIAPILSLLNERFAKLYLPAQEVSLDESLLKWKGRLSFSQLIGNKAAKVGIKTYELCESKTGYLLAMRVYAGKTSDSPEDLEIEAQDELEGATSKIVFDLMRPYLGKGHVLVMDNFYNSPLLSRLLKQQRTDTMGTLRLNREFIPESLKSTKTQMRVGEVAYSQTNDITVLAWRDVNLVAMISTYHKIEVSGKEKHGHYKYKPKVVLDYNLAMGGVDKKDQLLSAFPMERVRNATWYKKVFRRLLNITILNASIIYGTQAQMAARQFRQVLVDQILAKYKRGDPAVCAVSTTRPSRILRGGHYPEKLQSCNSRCKWCSLQGHRSRTSWQCDVCKVPLCVQCFKDYHTIR